MRREVERGMSEGRVSRRQRSEDSCPYVIERGPEIGYHCHLLRRDKSVDLGVMLTLEGQDVYAEPHRSSNICRIDISALGERARQEIGRRVGHELSGFPVEARRKHSKKAERIYSIPVS